jgi:hypothetical protein
MDDDIPHLKIERGGDGIGAGLILLEQEGGHGGPVDRIALHPIHLRHLAERAGLITATDLQTTRTIATLVRRLKVLRDRIEHLDYWLNNLSDSKHADLSYEQTYARATADIADEFCAEFDDSQAHAEKPADATAPAPTGAVAVEPQGSLL